MRINAKSSDALTEAYAALDGDSISALEPNCAAPQTHWGRSPIWARIMSSFLTRLSDMLYQLEDAAFEVHALRSSQEYDPQLMEQDGAPTERT